MAQSTHERPDSTPPSPISFGAWLHDPLNRLGVRGAFARDCLLAVIAALASVALLQGMLVTMGQAEEVTLSSGGTAALAALMVAQGLVLCVRRVNVLACLLVVSLAQLVISALMPSDVSFLTPAPLIAAYTCGVRLPVPRLLWIIGAVVTVQSVGIVFATAAQASPAAQPWASPATLSLVDDSVMVGSGPILSLAFSYVVAALTGTYVAMRRRYTELVRVNAEEAVRAQRERAEGAVRAERSRMARELHDIAAHHLSGMVVQAAAAERLIGRDEEAAREATSWVRSQGKETLDGLRLVVGALREPGERPLPSGDSLGHDGEPGTGGTPIPDLTAIDRLLETERALGATIEFEREGRSYPLSPIAGVTFYRVTQEALANAREHAAGAAVRVALRFAESEVVLEVENQPGRDLALEHAESAGTPRGLGLVGMHERAQLVGAVLRAGRTAAGGWNVTLTLPVSREVSGGRSSDAETGSA
ncbi:two-component sensor histidine kinase [Spiractinospora alimapuensis]|nr:two-component sensor histidine kinase [Spiractinospora alimapuensis]